MQHQRWQQIVCLCDAIAQEFHPDKIVLFGSYASGKPRPDLDIDLLVIMPFEGSPFRQVVRCAAFSAWILVCRFKAPAG
jgi:predicted nucleotidyltransferase